MKKLLFIFAVMLYTATSFASEDKNTVQTEQNYAVAQATFTGLV